MKEELSPSELNDVETVVDGLTYQCSKEDADGKVTLFASDVLFLIRYINTLRSDAVLASEKAVALTIEYENRQHEALSTTKELLERADGFLNVFASEDCECGDNATRTIDGWTAAPGTKCLSCRAASIHAAIRAAKETDNG